MVQSRCVAGREGHEDHLLHVLPTSEVERLCGVRYRSWIRCPEELDFLAGPGGETHLESRDRAHSDQAALDPSGPFLSDGAAGEANQG